MREAAPELVVPETLANLETRQFTYGAVLALLAPHPNLRGIYVDGGAMEGAFAALQKTGRPDVLLAVSPVDPGVSNGSRRRQRDARELYSAVSDSRTAATTTLEV